MQISIADDGTQARVTLIGRLDIIGAEKVALPLATLSGVKQNILIDMTGVNFLASIGIRHLVSAAKSLARRGGRLVLLNPSQVVGEVLTTAGLAAMFDIVGTESEAMTLLNARKA